MAQGSVKQVGLRMTMEASSVKTEAQAVGQALQDMQQKAAQSGNGLQALDGAQQKASQTAQQLSGDVGRMTTALIQGQGATSAVTSGAANMARTLAGAAPGLSLLVGGVVALGVAAYKGSREHAEHANALIMTGNAAGVTVGQLADMSRALAEGGRTQMAAAAAVNEMVRSTALGGDELQRYAGIALDWERVTGQAVSQTADKFSALQEEPLRASIRLNEGLNYLTASTYEHIKSLVEQGQKVDAVRVASDAFAGALAERTRGVTANLGLMERGWNSVKNAAMSAWDAMLNVGRAQTSSDKLADMRKELADLEAAQARAGFASNGGGAAFGRPNQEADNRRAARIAQLQAETEWLENGMQAERAAADAKAERVRVDKEGVAAIEAVSKVNEKALTRQEQMNKALNDYRANIEKIKAANPESQLLDPAKIAAAEKAIRDQYADRSGRAAALKAERDEARELAKDLRALAESAGLAPGFYEEWDRLNGLHAKGKMSVDELTAAQGKLLAQQPAIKAATDAQAKADAELVKMEAALRDERLRSADAQDKQATQLAEGNERLRDEIAQLGLSKEQQTLYTKAKLDSAIATKEEQLALAQKQFTNTREEAALQEQIRLLRERRDLLGQRAEKEADLEGAKAIEKTEKATEQMGQALADNLMRGGKNAKEYLEDLFRTAVLRPVLAPIMGSVAGVTSSMLGMGSTASGGAGGIGSLIGGNPLGSLLSGVTGFGGALSAGVGYGLSGVLAGNGIGTMLSAGTSMLGAGSIAGGLGTLLGVAAPVLAPLALLGLGGAFSRKHEQHNLVGTFGGETGFEGNWHDYYKGGMFRSSKTVDTPLEADFLLGLREAWKATEDAVEGHAAALGLSAEAIEGFTYDINLKLKDIDPKAGDYQQQVMARVTEAIRAGSNEMAELLIGSWDETVSTVTRQVRDYGDGDGWRAVEETVTTRTYTPSEYAREGEQAIDTLTRLGTSLQATNAAFDMLGTTLFEASLAGGDMASMLIDQMGGTEAFGAQVGSYWQAYYSEAERAAYVTGQITTALADVGLALPETRDGFRELVEAQDLTTEAGRAAFAALMGVSGAFAELTTSAESVAFGAASELADLIRDGLLGTFEGSDLGAAMAQTVQDGVYSAIAGGFAGQITQIIVSGVVQPVITAAMTGSSVSAAVSQASIQTMVAQAQAVAAAATEILNDPAFRAAMDAIGAAMQGIGAGVQAIDPSSIYYQAGRGADAAREASRAAEDAAKAQLDAWKTLLGEVEAIFDMTRDAARALRGEVDSTRTASAAAAQAFIDQALTTMRATGALPDAEGLRTAIDDARDGLRVQDYASVAEFERDQLILAGKLAEISEGAGRQKSFAERQIDLLDESNQIEKAQLDALRRMMQAGGVPGAGQLGTGRGWMGIVPGYAAGGLHLGGAHVVGENGPELRFDGPARYWSFEQSRAMLGGGGTNNAELIAELRAVKAELVALKAEMGRTTTATDSTSSLLKRLTGNGVAMPTRAVA